MQIQAGLLLLLAVSSAFAHPAYNPENDAEVITVPRGQQGVRKSEAADPDFNDFSGVVDTGSYPFFSRTPYNPFGNDFIDNFRSVFRRLGESLLNRWNAVGDFDPSKGNTTSVVEIIDGHKVEINDTVYTKADDSGHAVYKVRVVNIRPIDSGEDTATPGPENDKGSPEEVEKQPENNEVVSNIDSSENTKTHTTSTTHIPQDLEHVPHHNNLKKVENVGVEIHKDPKYESLEQKDQSDWKWNHDEQESEKKREQIRERFRNSIRRVTNHLVKTVENFQSHNGRSAQHERLSMPNRNPYQYATFKGQNRESLADESSEESAPEESAPEDILNFDDNTEWGVIKGEDFNKQYEIDKYGKVPVDLSNDIAINDILAEQGAPFDSRAEIIPVEQLRPNNRRPPFYYLSHHLRNANKMYHPIK